MSIDLTTNYGGLTLCSPVAVAACPLTANEQMRIAIASAGAGAIVLPSLFQEEILNWNVERGQELTRAEIQLVEGCMGESPIVDADSYLELVKASTAQSAIPVIASLNGSAVSHWVDFAGELQDAGADAIELNIHRQPPTAYGSARQIEDSIVQAVEMMEASLSVPLFVKLGREYTSMSHLAARLLSGAQGLVLFGRSPDLDISLDDYQLKCDWRLTSPGTITQSLGSIMRVHSYCPAMPIAASGGISSSGDVIKAILAGADVAMVASAIYREGPDLIRSYLDGLREFLESQRITSVRELRERRPIEFTTEDQRRIYKEALASKLAAEASQTEGPSMQGDRFGHPA